MVANDGVDFDLRKGEVHALLGENGAGKSTLMNILYGLYHPDEGEFRLNGSRCASTRRAKRSTRGIGMVHQHFMLIPVMTVAENIVLAAEPTKGPFMDEGEAEKRVRELSRAVRARGAPDARIESISVGMQQRVEILKALYRGAEILILDEPTAVLTPQEASELFEIIDSLKAEGKSIIFITHKLNEVLEIADRITVLRRGKTIDTVPREGATEEGLARLMVGREVILRVDKSQAEPGEPLLTVEDLYVDDERGLEAVRGISFEVKAGEIVGIAGVDGNGQIGADRRDHGPAQGESGPNRRRPATTSRTTRRASAWTQESATSPRTASCAVSSSISRLAENIALHDYREEPDSKYGWLFPRRLIARARTLLKEFDVRGGGPETRAAALSGGNQQKVDRRARGLARPERPRRGAADPRPRRRRDRVRPSPARRRAGRGTRDPARLLRARRGPVALRPDPRHLRRPDRRRVQPGRLRGGDRVRDGGRERKATAA